MSRNEKTPQELQQVIENKTNKTVRRRLLLMLQMGTIPEHFSSVTAEAQGTVASEILTQLGFTNTLSSSYKFKD